MPRGAPDYGNVRAGLPLHRLDDHAELAARMGGVDTYERAGYVIYLDDFSKGAPQWGTAPYGTGAEIAVSASRALSPPFSLKLVTGSDGACGAKATFEVAYHHLCKMGLEYAFTHTVNAVYHFMTLSHYSGTVKRTYMVLFYIQDGNIGYKNADGGFTAIVEGINLKSDAFIFNQAKLVVDTENNEYVRFYFNDAMYDLAGAKPLEEASSSVPYLETSIQFTGPAGSNQTHYVDNLIITQNEP